MNLPLVFITQKKIGDELREIYRENLGAAAELAFAADGLDDAARASAFAQAGVLVVGNLRVELSEAELGNLKNVGLIQALTAGVDHIPFSTLPDGVPVAYNPGVYAEPMAEHVVAMAFAAGKRLAGEHAAMRDGAFNQFVPTRSMAGSNCAILGFGGVGRAVANKLGALGVSIHAVNRRGATDQPVDGVSTLNNLETILGAADIVVIGMSLTRKTLGLIGRRELGWMKPDAILINVSRGELIDQTALYEHLVAHPDFTACIDAWWVEPVRHGEFRIEHPFLVLPNVIASPHNSAQVPGVHTEPARMAAENVGRFLSGEPPLHLVGDDEKLR